MRNGSELMLLISNGVSEITRGNREAATGWQNRSGQHETEEETTINPLRGGNVSYL